MEHFMGRPVIRHSPARQPRTTDLIEPAEGDIAFLHKRKQAVTKELESLAPPQDKSAQTKEYEAEQRKLNIKRGMGNISESDWNKAHQELRKKYGQE